LRELLRFLLIGVVASWIASIVVRGRIVRLRGCLTYTTFGVTGALAGGYLLDQIGLSDVISVVAAAAGAIAMLVFLQRVRNA
jgi:uncharacterized membrane protein YeaQ/YmgE (transglycosylase-associated protein family)